VGYGCNIVSSVNSGHCTELHKEGEAHNHISIRSDPSRHQPACHSLAGSDLPREIEVAQLGIALFVDEDIVRLHCVPEEQSSDRSEHVGA